VIYLFSFPTWWIKKQYIRRASNKIQAYKGLIVIGITGSYGKSSVKEFLAHIIGSKFRVIKTPKNVNTEIGVAKFILETDFSDADVFIVEMGAYRTGEIKLICDMVRPSIGILTAITEQHLSLFGSMEHIQQAKYELLRALPKDGYAVTNADNHYCTEFLEELRVEKKETFGTEKVNQPTCLITNVKMTPEGIECEGEYRGKRRKLFAPIIGAHHVYNIAPAVMVGVHLGLSAENIIDAAATIPKNIHGSIRIYPYGEATIIDDSYNSNPEGFKAALDILSSFPTSRRRIVITRGMLELGERSDELHEQIGGEIAFVADELVVISEDSFLAIKKGVGDKYRTKILFKNTSKDLLEYISSLEHEPAVILLENRISQVVMEEISKHKPNI
jgi:UDP-N-acetylmuramoyl-tripeptide--D-alanyl-D-alanine ligase